MCIIVPELVAAYSDDSPRRLAKASALDAPVSDRSVDRARAFRRITSYLPIVYHIHSHVLVAVGVLSESLRSQGANFACFNPIRVRETRRLHLH